MWEPVRRFRGLTPNSHLFEELDMARLFRSSRPDSWSSPRAYSDATYRAMSHGKILPMEEPSFFARLFNRY